MKYRLYMNFIETLVEDVEADSKEEAEKKGYQIIEDHVVLTYENPDVNVSLIP